LGGRPHRAENAKEIKRGSNGDLKIRLKRGDQSHAEGCGRPKNSAYCGKCEKGTFIQTKNKSPNTDMLAGHPE